MTSLLAVVVVLSVLTVVGSIVALPVVLLRMPADYLTRAHPPEDSFRARHPVLRICLKAAKNLAGALLVVLGIILLPGPGQGLLTIIIGLSLMDFPGKRAWELRLLARPRMLGLINMIRSKAGRPPLEDPNKAAKDPLEDPKDPHEEPDAKGVESLSRS